MSTCGSCPTSTAAVDAVGTLVRELRAGRLSRRAVLGHGAALGLGTTLLGTRSGGAQETPGDELMIAVSLDPDCWNPIEGPCGADIEYHDLVMERLLTWNWEGDGAAQLAPGLATSWEVVDDLTWELALREGVTFTNGEPFNADAVLFMFQPILNPEEYNPPPTAVGRYRLLDRIEKIDDYTVRFITSEPFPLLGNYLAYEPRAVPPAYYSEVGAEEFGRAPIGTGPYQLEEWVRNDHFTLTANPDYWGGAPAIEQLTFRPIPEAATRVAELLSGGADIAAQVPGELVPDLEASDEVRPVVIPSVQLAYINLRAEDRLTDLALREAFQYATNVDIIIEQILGGLADKVPAGNPVTRFEFGFDPEVPDWPYDPELARQKLEEAGYDGHEIEMIYEIGALAQIDLVAQALQAQWAEVGLNVSLQGLEAGVWNTHWRERTMPGDIFLNTTSSSALDSDSRLVAHTHCYDPDRGLGRVSWFCDPAIDVLHEESQVTLDQAKRAELLSEIWAMNRDSAHIISLYAPYLVYGVRNGVEWEPTPKDLYSTLATATVD